MDNKRKEERQRNRTALKAIIQTIMLCGKNELPLRGDRDNGPLTLEKPEKKDGNFRALLRFRAETDYDLKQHILSLLPPKCNVCQSSNPKRNYKYLWTNN